MDVYILHCRKCLRCTTSGSFKIIDPLSSQPNWLPLDHSFALAIFHDRGVTMRTTRAISIALILPFSVTLVACSTHPLPEDVTRKTTYQIVERLRCEARAGVEQIRHEINDPITLSDTFVGFDFDLDMQETDKATGGKLTLTNPVNGGSVKFDITGSGEKIRRNIRRFRVIDSFQQLIDYKFCGETQRRNSIYPITGKVGLEEVVSTYWKLRSLTRYSAEEKENIFSDELTFTTTIGTGLTPTIDISPNVGGVKLTDATIAGALERRDVHKVTMAIAPRGRGYSKDVLLLATEVSPGLESDAGNVIQELNRIRAINDRLRSLDPLFVP